MRRVLVLTGFWPPLGGPGTLRTYKTCQELPALGWAPTVLTPDPRRLRSQSVLQLPPRPNGVALRYTEFDDRLDRLRRLFSKGTKTDSGQSRHARNADQAFKPPRYKEWARAFMAFPDEHAGWIPHAVDGGLHALSEGFDLIWTTSPPESAHMAGRILKKRSGIPWVAELRDPWADYHHVHRGWLLRFMQRLAESRCLSSADILVTLSPTWRQHFARTLRKPVALVRSGFDPSDLPSAAGSVEDREVFRFVYTGKLHPEQQDPSDFFVALAQLRSHRIVRQSRVRVDLYFYGDGLEELRSMVSRLGLDDLVHFEAPVSYHESLRRQSEATVLLLFDWEGEGPIERGVIPLKAYEYMATRRPVLVFLKKEGDLAELARQGPQFHAVRSVEEAVRQMESWLESFATAGCLSPSHRAPAESLAFTRRAAAETFARLFDGLIDDDSAVKGSLQYA